MVLSFLDALHVQSKEVIEIVETTITVIFDCDKDPWVTLKPKEQQVGIEQWYWDYAQALNRKAVLNATT